MSALFLAMLMVGVAQASVKEERSLSSLASEELFERGKAFQTTRPDSALMCYSIIEGRYHSKMSPDEVDLCLQSLLNKWLIYFYDLYDYAGAYECLSKAEEIADAENLTIPAIELQLGTLHQVISEQTRNKEAAREAFLHYRKGLREALAVGDTLRADILASNLTQHSYHIDYLDSIREDWRAYREARAPGGGFVYSYNVRMKDGLTLLKAGRYDECMAIFDSLFRISPSVPKSVRYKLNARLNHAMALKDMGEYAKAVSMLYEPLRITEAMHMKDGQMEVYERLSECYGEMGDFSRAMEYENKSLRLKDSLVNYSQLTRLEEVKSGRDLRKYQERLIVVETERRMQRVVTGVIAGSLALVVVLLFVLFNKNRRLKMSNKVLYAKNIDMLRHAEKEMSLRKDFEQRLQAVASRDDALQEDFSLEKKQPEVKYKGSRLAEQDKADLLDAVGLAMDTTDEYLNPDFSIERLAELAGSKPRLVSQVINELRGCNFNNFVNGYRIREACRRINDVDNYGRLTLDAISKSVGFRARSSFFTSFKAVTGLTPSEFQKLARSDRK